jgi:hypothetical protein
MKRSYGTLVRSRSSVVEHVEVPLTNARPLSEAEALPAARSQSPVALN